MGQEGIGTSASSDFSPTGSLKTSATIQHKHYNFTQGYKFDSWKMKNVDLGANNPGSNIGGTPATSGDVTHEPQPRQEGDDMGYRPRRHSKQRLVQRSQSLDPGAGGRQQTSFHSSFPTSLPTSLSPYAPNHPTQSTLLGRQGIEGLYGQGGQQAAGGTSRTQGFSTGRSHSPLAPTIPEPKSGYSGDVSSRRSSGGKAKGGAGPSEARAGSHVASQFLEGSLESSRVNPIPLHDTQKSEQDKKKKKRKSGKVSISDLLD